MFFVTCIRAFYRFSACSLTTGSQDSVCGKGSVRFMCGPVHFIRAWEFDYVCGHRADAINGLGNIGMVSRAGSFRAR